VVLRAQNVSVADLLQENMTVDELASKGFAASELLDAGVSCDEVEREYGKQTSECGSSTGLIIAIVAIVMLIGATVGGAVWFRQQNAPSFKPAGPATRRARPPRQQPGSMLCNPTFSMQDKLQADTTNVEYDFATDALAFPAKGFVVNTTSGSKFGGSSAAAGASARRSSYSTAIGSSDDNLDLYGLPPAQRALSLHSGAQCQRPAPCGGTCRNGVFAGGKFCKGHTCTISGCAETKSGKLHTCPEHSTTKFKRERAFSVVVQVDGILRVKKDGADVYVLPPGGGGGGGERTSKSASDAGMLTPTGRPFTKHPPQQRLASASNSSRTASDYSLVPLGAAAFVPSSNGTLYTVPSAHEIGATAYAMEENANEWAANDAKMIECGIIEDGSADKITTEHSSNARMEASTKFDTLNASASESKGTFGESAAAVKRLPTARRKVSTGISRGGRQGSELSGFDDSVSGPLETAADTEAAAGDCQPTVSREAVACGSQKAKQERSGISRGGGGRKGSVYNGFGEYFAEKALPTNAESDL
jgi:hypothetical protein